jgi:sugar phosphate isomerase/epimerase
MPPLAATAPFGFTFDLPRLLTAYRSLGVQQLQFYRNEKNPPTVEAALRLSAQLALPFDSIHGLFGPHIDPTSPDTAQRDAALRIYEDEGKLARDLNGPMVVVHPSAQSPDLKPIPQDELQRQALERTPRLHDWLKRLADVGSKLNVVYLIENQPFNCALGHDPLALARSIRQINSPFIRMCFDTGHAHLTANVTDALTQTADVISYLHIHDNDTTLDDHRMPSDGTINWPAFASALRASNNQSPRMLEVFYEEPRIENLVKQGFKSKLAEMCAL